MTETHETESRITVRPAMALAQRNRPRGLYGQITTSLLRPGLFYRTLQPASETRQWLWAAILILALVGIATVRYSALSSAADQGAGTVDPGFVDPGFVDPGIGDDFGGDFGSDFGGVPPGGGPVDPGAPATGESTLTADLTMALLAASNILLGWVVLTGMLVVVPMLRGRAPKVGLNLQVAIWSSLPLAVMAVVQLVYWSGGGKLGEPGVQGLLSDWKDFDSLGSTTQALLISLTSRLTVFWLWSLVLVYFGARFALGGWRIVALLIVVAWAGIQIVAPVVTETIVAPAIEESATLDPGMGGDGMPLDGGLGVPDGGDTGGEPETGSPEPPGEESSPSEARPGGGGGGG